MENLRNKRDDLRIKRYYSIKINRGRGYIGSLIDKFIFRVSIFTILLLYLYIETKNIILSLALSLSLGAIYCVLAHKINKRKFNQSIELLNKKLAAEKIYRNFMNKSTDRYVDYIKEIMKFYGVGDMKKIIRKDLDLVGNLNGEKIGIKCYQYSEEHKVDRNDMKNFFIEIRDNEINKGIIITTSSFSEEAKDFFSSIEVDIQFLTIDNIIDIIKETSIYPKKEDIEKMILKQLDESRVRVRNEGKKIISKDNTKSCVIAGIVIILFSKFTLFNLYYKIFGCILIALGLVPVVQSSINLILSGKIEDDV